MYCLCVNVYCHRVATQLQLTNISYHIIKIGHMYISIKKRLFGRPRDRCEDYITRKRVDIGCGDEKWTELAQSRAR